MAVFLAEDWTSLRGLHFPSAALLLADYSAPVLRKGSERDANSPV